MSSAGEAPSYTLWEHAQDLWRLRWKRRLRAAHIELLWCMGITAWLGSFWMACRYDCGRLYFIASALTAIFGCLLTAKERAPGTLSAWSVFNPNFETIPGTMDVDRQLRGRSMASQSSAPSSSPYVDTKHTAAYLERLRICTLSRNDPCLCGSDRKFKSCCLPTKQSLSG